MSNPKIDENGFATLRVVLSPDDWARLDALAKAKGISAGDAVRGFIRACQPGGSGWVHPAKAATT